MLSWSDDAALMNELLASDNVLIARAAAEGFRRKQQLSWEVQQEGKDAGANPSR